MFYPAEVAYARLAIGRVAGECEHKPGSSRAGPPEPPVLLGEHRGFSGSGRHANWLPSARYTTVDPQPGAPGLWVTSFAPGTTAFVGTIVKVYGVMRALPAVDGGRHVLRINFNYLFVYPVERPGNLLPGCGSLRTDGERGLRAVGSGGRRAPGVVAWRRRQCGRALRDE